LKYTRYLANSAGRLTASSNSFLRWTTEQADAIASARCPNCGDLAPKVAVLSAPWPRPGGTPQPADLLKCDRCGCGFFHDVAAADYGTEQPGHTGALAFYLQQGAGLGGIASNLTSLGMPPGTRLLEIGCGFGLGLDFARRALGWHVLGMDPSPLAAAGRSLLGLPIEQAYLQRDDPQLGGRFDVVMASEVIEHVTSPPDFLRTLHSALCEGGTLVLTTPDIDAVRVDTPSGLLVPLLSVGFHLVLQSKESLALLLRQAGFEAIEVRQVGGASLHAQARRGESESAAQWSHATGRDTYRRYLHDAAQATEFGSDLWFGLTTRAYREAVSASDLETADRLWHGFRSACCLFLSLDPEVRQPALLDTGIEALVRREPLALGPVLLHRAYHRMQAGETRTDVAALFDLSVQACSRLRRALNQIGADDGDTEDIAWTAAAEALLCAAERGTEGVTEMIASLGPAPGDAAAVRLGEEGRLASFRRRAFVSLVNAGSYEQSDDLADSVVSICALTTVPQPPVLPDDALDLLYCAAVRELQRQPPVPELALALLQGLRVASSVARGAGRNGSARTLTAPAREAEELALTMLGRADIPHIHHRSP
jgi:2-polyprenyl-3-methyl-5-hydroxy-6-metoxy-1,4-benzoquinol methylase